MILVDRRPPGDALLDGFMPRFEVRESHSVPIRAPAGVVLEAAKRIRLGRSWPLRAIFWLRARMLGAEPRPLSAAGLVESAEAMGWGRLAEVPDREIVMGALTQPWAPDVVFHPIAPGAFAQYAEPDHVKIAWTLRADPVSASRCVFRTETRVAACDDSARRKFRRYWWIFSPGILLIRLLLLGPLRRDAERAARRLPGGH